MGSFYGYYGSVKAIFFTVIVVLLCLPTLTQGQSFSIKGSVVDGKDNQSLIGVVVTVGAKSDSSKTLNGVTDVDGAFTIPGVTPGEYTLKAIYLGYETISRSIKVQTADVATGL